MISAVKTAAVQYSGGVVVLELLHVFTRCNPCSTLSFPSSTHPLLHTTCSSLLLFFSSCTYHSFHSSGSSMLAAAHNGARARDAQPPSGAFNGVNGDQVESPGSEGEGWKEGGVDSRSSVPSGIDVNVGGSMGGIDSPEGNNSAATGGNADIGGEGTMSFGGKSDGADGDSGKDNGAGGNHGNNGNNVSNGSTSNVSDEAPTKTDEQGVQGGGGRSSKGSNAEQGSGREETAASSGSGERKESGGARQNGSTSSFSSEVGGGAGAGLQGQKRGGSGAQGAQGTQERESNGVSSGDKQKGGGSAGSADEIAQQTKRALLKGGVFLKVRIVTLC